MGVTDLHDSFKIKAHSIPQGKLPAARGGKQAAALRSPPNNIDGVFDFIQRCVEMLGRYTVCWA
jgi:hypothetical protein